MMEATQTKTWRTSEQTEKNQLSVALLMEDMQEAKELSRVFKKMEIHPYVYTDLRSFWQGTLERLPSLSIVDVKLSSQSGLFLKDHPYLKTEQMPLAFYLSEQNKPLLHSVYEIFHLGVIRKGESYLGQVKSTLKRLNKMISLEETTQSESFKTKKFDQQISRLIEQNESLKEKSYYHRLLNSYCQRFEMRDAEDFFSACAQSLQSFKEVQEFAFLELSSNKQKLISPELNESKYRKIPALWLGQTCADGIELFAQNMASQVGVDLMGGELMSLSIKGAKENPEAMLFIRVEETQMLNFFEWDALERFLSGLYSTYQLRNSRSVTGPGRWLSAWDLMSIIDEQLYENKEADGPQLINVEFSSLVNRIQEKNERFYWKNFFEDFINRLNAHVSEDFQVSPFGVDVLSFLVPKKEADSFFIQLKNYAARYPYWKYFANSDVALAQSLKPVVRMVPFSSRGYLKSIEQIIAPEVKKAVEESPQKVQVWGPGPEIDM